MKKLLYISLFISMILVVFNCKKNIGRVKVEFRGHSTVFQRGSLGFNGAVSHHLDSIYSFETTFNKTNNDCESFGDFAGIQAGIRKQNTPGFFLDYYLGHNVVPIGDGTAIMYKTNHFKWYLHHDNRWRININNDDVAEFDVNQDYNDGYIGFGMCQSGTVKDIIWQPAFLFNGSEPDNISNFWNSRGVIRIYLDQNKVIGSEK